MNYSQRGGSEPFVKKYIGFTGEHALFVYSLYEGIAYVQPYLLSLIFIASICDVVPTSHAS
jgi:hypothetical protein